MLEKGVCARRVDGLARSQRRGPSVRAGEDRSAHRRNQGRTYGGCGAEPEYQQASAALQGLQVDDAEQLEPPAPSRGEGGIDKRRSQSSLRRTSLTRAECKGRDLYEKLYCTNARLARLTRAPQRVTHAASPPGPPSPLRDFPSQISFKHSRVSGRHDLHVCKKANKHRRSSVLGKGLPADGCPLYYRCALCAHVIDGYFNCWSSLTALAVLENLSASKPPAA